MNPTARRTAFAHTRTHTYTHIRTHTHTHTHTYAHTRIQRTSMRCTAQTCVQPKRRPFAESCGERLDSSGDVLLDVASVVCVQDGLACGDGSRGTSGRGRQGGKKQAAGWDATACSEVWSRVGWQGDAAGRSCRAGRQGWAAGLGGRVGRQGGPTSMRDVIGSEARTGAHPVLPACARTLRM